VRFGLAEAKPPLALSAIQPALDCLRPVLFFALDGLPKARWAEVLFGIRE
jgi:hypothetical protein